METPLFLDLECQLQCIMQAVVNVQTLEPPAWTLTETDGTIRLQVCWTNKSSTEISKLPSKLPASVTIPSSNNACDRGNCLEDAECAENSVRVDPTVVLKTGKKKKSPSTLRRDKNRLLKWLELKKMNTDTNSISSNIPTNNADDVNIALRAQQNMNTVSELTVLAEDNSGIPYNSSIIVSLPTVSSCFNETSISNTCNKPTCPTTINSYSSDRASRIQKGRKILRRWQLMRRSYTHKGKPTSMMLYPDY